MPETPAPHRDPTEMEVFLLCSLLFGLGAGIVFAALLFRERQALQILDIIIGKVTQWVQ